MSGASGVASHEQLEQHRARLERMVRVRLAPQLRRRVDPADVVQECLIEAVGRLDAYRADPAVPLFTWLRFLCRQRLTAVHRHHLGVAARAAGRELTPRPGESALLAEMISGHLTSPSQAAMRLELQQRLHDALQAMPERDREVLVLRHYEQLDRAETARELGLSTAAAGKRYLRALRRLRGLLCDLDPKTPAAG